MSHDAQRCDENSQLLSARRLDNIATGVERSLRQGAFSTTRWANRKLVDDIRDQARQRGMTVCEYGCFTGEPSIYLSLATPTARVLAFDVSPQAVELGRSLNERLGGRVKFFTGDAMSLDLESESIDYAFGLGVLHHVHTRETYEELFRVLRPGGRAGFVEPSRFNPLINMYRKVRREEYSPDERPFDCAMLQEVEAWLPGAELTWRHEQFLTMFLLLAHGLYAKLLPALERRPASKRLTDSLLGPVGHLDDVLLRGVPGLRRFGQLLVLQLRER